MLDETAAAVAAVIEGEKVTYDEGQVQLQCQQNERSHHPVAVAADAANLLALQAQQKKKQGTRDGGTCALGGVSWLCWRRQYSHSQMRRRPPRSRR